MTRYDNSLGGFPCCNGDYRRDDPDLLLRRRYGFRIPTDLILYLYVEALTKVFLSEGLVRDLLLAAHACTAHVSVVLVSDGVFELADRVDYVFVED